MQRSDLVRYVCDRIEIHEDLANAVLTTAFEGMENWFIAGKPVNIRGWGAFRVVTIAGSNRPNPGTGERTEFPPSTTVRWKPAPRLRDRLNGRVRRRKQ